MQKKYHYVYLITNIENGKQYIGKHSTNNLDDGYKGSGVIIKKINAQILEKEILEFCDSEEEAYEREKYWINHYDAYNNPNFYNLDEGGHGNSSQEMKDRWTSGVYDTPEYRQKQSNIMKARNQQPEFAERRRQGWERWWNNLTPEEKEARNQRGANNPMWGKQHSTESVLKNKMHQPNLLKIYCEEEPDLIFYGLKDAGKWAGLKDAAGIGRCLKGKNKTAGKHPITKQPCHWHKLEE